MIFIWQQEQAQDADWGQAADYQLAWQDADWWQTADWWQSAANNGTAANNGQAADPLATLAHLAAGAGPAHPPFDHVVAAAAALPVLNGRDMDFLQAPVRTVMKKYYFSLIKFPFSACVPERTARYSPVGKAGDRGPGALALVAR